MDDLDSAEILAATHKLLRFWGLWLYCNNDPGCGYPHENTISRHMKRGPDFWLDDEAGKTDWTDAERVDEAVRFIAQLAPAIAMALRASYEYHPEYKALPKKAEQFARLNRLIVLTGKSVSGSRMRSMQVEGKRLVAGYLAALGREAA